jgi:hypothetical protein
MTLDAARAMDEGGEARVEIALIKFWGARMLHNVIDRAIQVHGALGVTADTPLESMYREARYARIYDGPDEVHRMTGGAADAQGSLRQSAMGVTGARMKVARLLLDNFGASAVPLITSTGGRRTNVELEASRRGWRRCCAARLARATAFSS